MSVLAAACLPVAAATLRTSRQMSLSFSGLSDTTLTSGVKKHCTASSTSGRETAHTSHWSWVTMTSGFKSCSASVFRR